VPYSLLAVLAGLILCLNSSLAIAGAPTNFQKHNNKLTEGRALYEAQVNFGGARENDLGQGFDFGVPPKPREFTRTN
jgi:hypothetical protein